MESLKLLIYDFHKDKSYEDVNDFFKVINTYENLRICESAYIIRTYDRPEIIYQRFDPYVDPRDNVLIVTMAEPFYGQHRKPVIDWLEKTLQLA